MSQQIAVKSALDAKLVNAMVDAVLEVLNTMAATQASLKQVSPQPDYQPTGDISSVIGVAGEDGEGMIAISFPNSLANTLVARLLGMDPHRLAKDDRIDGIGEIVNMISGRAKTVLSEGCAAPYKLSLPSIILGSQHEVASRPKNVPFLAMQFEAEGEHFTLQVTFRNFR